MAQSPGGKLNIGTCVLAPGAAADGTDNTGINQPSGGSGIRGWLSAIYLKLSGTLAVTVGNFPATQAVTLATNIPDITDRATRETGRVRLWDGTDEATVIPRDSASTSTDKGLAVVKLSQHAPGYQVVTTEITSATTVGVKENLTLWHPAATAKNVYIVEIGANIRVVQSVGTFAWELQYISAENGTPGGTTITAQPLNLGDAASGLTTRQVPTGAPTVSGQIFQRASFPLPAAATPYTGGPEGFIIFRAEDRDNFTDAIQFRSGQAEGLRISQDVLAAITTAPVFTLYVKYVERA